MNLGKQRYEAKYLAIQYFFKERNWSINWMCKQLGVSHAAYYKWLKRTPSKLEIENREIAVLIEEYHEKFGHVLGYRRMTGMINRLNGTQYTKKRVYGIMRKLGIHSVVRRKRKNYPKVTPDMVAENKLQRNFNTTRPNEKWVTDVTEFKVPHTNKKIFLNLIFDLYDRTSVAYTISRANNIPSTLKTFEKAIEANPNAHPLFHSDRGFQFTSKEFKLRLQIQGMEQSMSRAGHCIDNGPIEGLWGIIKTEMYCMFKITDEKSLIEAIHQYIRFYNEERPQERYGDKTPLEVRNEALQSTTPKEYPIAENKRIQKYKAKWKAA